MRQRLDHGLAVPVVVGPVVRIEPGHLFVVPDLGAHLAGVLLQDAPLPAVEVESSGVVRSDAELVAQVAFIERRVAAPEHEAAGDLDFVAAHIREILLRRGRIGLGHAAHALPREHAPPVPDGPGIDLLGAAAHGVDHAGPDAVLPALRVTVDGAPQQVVERREGGGLHQPRFLILAVADGTDHIAEIPLLRAAALGIHPGQQDADTIPAVHRAGHRAARPVVAQGKDGVLGAIRMFLLPRLGLVLVLEVLEVVQFAALPVLEGRSGHFGQAHKI